MPRDDTDVANRLRAHLLHFAKEVERAHKIVLEAADTCILARPFVVEELAMVSATLRSFEKQLRGYESGLATAAGGDDE